MYTQNDKYMYKNDKAVRRFSKSFKLKVLDELSTGKYSKKINIMKGGFYSKRYVNPVRLEAQIFNV